MAMGRKADGKQDRPAAKVQRRRIILLALAAALVLWTIGGNLMVGLTRYDVSGAPAGFDGYTIAQISDFHNAHCGPSAEAVAAVLRKAQPECIVFTGDLVDSRQTDVEKAMALARLAVEIAPCYYVTGNHEARLGAQFDTLAAQLAACGVTVLRNSAVTLERGGDAVALCGVDDPRFAYETPADEVLTREIEAAYAPAGYRILLSHRPDALEVYAASGVQLVFCGHAHGGQFRLPFVGGLFAPDQGLFPAYDAGVYQQSGATMVVSRGIGNSAFPFRVNNPPEVVLVTLHAGD